MEISPSVLIITVAVVLLNQSVSSLESTSPEKYLRPRDFNPHPYTGNQQSSTGFSQGRIRERLADNVQQQVQASAARNGPVLFPNDAPPPPRPPLVVTSRPISEQIARSELSDVNLTPGPPRAQNQNVDQDGYLIGVSDPNDYIVSNGYRQRVTNQNGAFQIRNNDALENSNGYVVNSNGFLGRIVDSNGAQRLGIVFNDYQDVEGDNNFRQFGANGNQRLTNVYQGVVNQGGEEQLVNSNGYLTHDRQSNNTLLDRHPYAAVAKKSKFLKGNGGRQGSSAFEERTAAPPIYNALGNYAKTKVLKNKRKHKQNSSNRYSVHDTNTVDIRKSKDGDDDEYYTDNSANEAKHYAFSYSVKDHHTGDDFSHSQRKSGSGTNGEYRVKLPDGRVQIVSYTADNGGYNANVRYENDPENDEQQSSGPPPRPTLPTQGYISTIPDYNPYRSSPVGLNPGSSAATFVLQHQQQNKLGRIVVPSREEKDYQDVDYFYDDNVKTSDRNIVPSHRLVTNDVKEVLITSKPGYLQTASPTPSNLLYKQLVYHGDNEQGVLNYVVTPTSIVYVQPNNGGHLVSESPQSGFRTSTDSGQDVSRKYLHFYNAESVKFVSTTPKYATIDDNSISTGGGYVTSASPNSGYYSTASTPAPGIDGYDHLDTPEVARYRVKPETVYSGQRRYTTVAPVVNSALRDGAVTPTHFLRQDANDVRKNPQGIGLGRYYAPPDSIDLRKYFSYNKR